MLGFPLLGILLALLLLGLIFKLAKQIVDQISQLSYQNKLLTAMRHLDVVALSTTEIDPLCQEIVDVIRKELGYFFGSIALIDEKLGGLRRIAISHSPAMEEAIAGLPIEYKKQVVPLGLKDNVLIKALDEKKSLYTERLFDVQLGIFPLETSDSLQKILSIKGIFVYPLITKGKTMGVIYYCTLIDKEKFSRFEFDVMDEFSREVNRVLDNIFLYQDLRETSRELADANEKLKQLDKLKDDFVSIASHELRTPMTAIRSYAWMALNRPDITLSEKMKKYLSRVVISTERLINLVNDMLNVSRIEAGRIEIRPRIFDIHTLVDEVMAEAMPKAQEKMIRIEVGKDILPKVFADPDKVHEILLNLVGNALKFTPTDGLVSINFSSDGNLVEISVKDSGVGISRDDLSKLFKKFERLDNSYVAAATSGGTGLGLYISKSLVDLMCGRIWATSEGLGKGATFSFSLPIATPEVVSRSDRFSKRPIGEAKPLEPVAI